jgi:hypothetical protein
MESDDGVKRSMKNTNISFKTKSNFKGKSDRNATIKCITA